MLSSIQKSKKVSLPITDNFKVKIGYINGNRKG